MTLVYFIVGTVFLAMGVLCIVKAVKINSHKSDINSNKE